MFKKIYKKKLEKMWVSYNVNEKKEFLQQLLLNVNDDNVYNGLIDELNQYNEEQLDIYFINILKEI